MKPGEDLKILFLFVLATVLYQIGITGQRSIRRRYTVARWVDR